MARFHCGSSTTFEANRNGEQHISPSNTFGSCLRRQFRRSQVLLPSTLCAMSSSTVLARGGAEAAAEGLSSAVPDQLGCVRKSSRGRMCKCRRSTTRWTRIVTLTSCEVDQGTASCDVPNAAYAKQKQSVSHSCRGCTCLYPQPSSDSLEYSRYRHHDAQP